MAGEKIEPIVEEGKNVWRIARASEAAMIVDAADYFRTIGKAMRKAKERIFIVGWDFDTRISLDPEDDHEYGDSLGHLFIELARERPTREIDVLKWNFGALKQFLSLRAIYWLFRWWLAKNIHMKFDSAHPPGCSHHQKIVVIDEHLAACGGIDISSRRWDTPDHEPDDERRKTPNDRSYGPWHDTTMLMRGPIAGVLGELGRERWKMATSKKLDPVPSGKVEWPSDIRVQFNDVDVGIARTRASYRDVDEVRENEQLAIDMICAADRLVYIENQYFTAPRVAAAIAARLNAPDPPEIVMVMPRRGDGWLESVAMDGTRQKLMQAIQRLREGDRFRIYVPVNRAGEDIYVHAKVAIVDDRLLRVGSANLNNRSMGLDSECDVVIDSALPSNHGTEASIRALRHRLLGEHLGVDPLVVEKAEEAEGSLIAAIERLRGEGKTLTPLEADPLSDLDQFVAEHELLDPETTEEMFEPIARKNLSQRWLRSRKRLRRLVRGRH